MLLSWMVGSRRRGWGGRSLGVMVLSLLATTVRASVLDDIPVALGYAAWDLCTRVLATGDDEARVRTLYTAPKVSPLPWLWRIQMQPGQSVTVRTWLPVPSWQRVAVFKPGLGCTVLPPGVNEADWSRQLPAVPHQEAVASDKAQPWPQGDAPAHVLSTHTALPLALERAADLLFDEVPGATAKQRQNTQAVLVAYQGQLVYERYGMGVDAQRPLLGWSMTKTLTTLWAGALQGQGLWSLDEPLPIAGWAGTDKARITWRHALQMRTGLAWDEVHTGYSSVAEMMFSRADHAAYVAEQPLAHAPGEVFAYNTGSTTLVSRALRNRLGDDPGRTLASLRDSLLAPLGIQSGWVELDASGTPAGGGRGVLRARDWLKLGELLCTQGQWQGRQVVPAGFIQFMTSPSPAFAGYGAGLRLYDTALMPASMPHDTVYLAGLQGQYIVVVPSQQLVLLRMGVAHDQEETRRRVFDATLGLVRALQQPPEPVLAQVLEP